LWTGQVCSAVGDEINRVGAVWLGAQLLGAGAGLPALGSGVALVTTLLSGPLADRLDRRLTMVVADLVRAVAVLSVPLAAWAHAPLLPVLVGVVVILAAAKAFFEPALRSSLTLIAPSPELLQATNGLMETTDRMARVVGPGLIGVLGATLPLVHFFTLDAVSFVLSAVSVTALGAAVLQRPKSLAPVRLAGSGWRLVRADPLVFHVVLTTGIVTGAWILFFPLGIGLKVKAMTDDVGAFGFVIAAYGVGNLASNLVLGSLRLRRPERALVLGRVCAGVGFLGLALAPSLPLTMVAAAVAAAGGPATDIGLLAVMQERYGPDDFTRVYRLVLASAHAGTLLVLGISAPLFERFGVDAVLVADAALLLGIGLVGIALFERRLVQESA
jgi:MFS family permease